MRAWEYQQPIPNASVVNYSNVAGLNIANGVIVPITGITGSGFDISIRADVSGTHVVADVSGYFTRFPVESVRPTITIATPTAGTSLADGACHAVISCSVARPVDGTVVLSSDGITSVSHTNGTDDVLVWELEVNAVACAGSSVINERITAYSVPAPFPTAVQAGSVAITHAFPVSAGPNTTYLVSAKMASGASAGDQINLARMTCMFYPN